MKHSDTVLLIFAKAPVPGEVNTRLIPDIGIDAATALHMELISHRLKTCVESGLCEVQLWCAPDCEHEYLASCTKKYGVTAYPQQGDNLGERMSSAISHSLENYNHVIIVGTDAPALDMVQIEKAITSLKEGCGIVIVPAEDGGYVLIGMSQHYDRVFFSVPWGTDRVLKKTRGNIIAMGKKHRELEVCWDIDRLEDYERYHELKKKKI